MFFFYCSGKLPFGVPKGIDGYKHSQLEEIVIKFYREAKRCEKSTLAYKGGNLTWLETCGHHYGEHSYQRCPK